MTARIHISTSWVGPRCFVQLDDGKIVEGYRVPSDYVPAGESEGTYWGRCVSVRTLDRKSGLEIFVDGVQQTGRSANGYSWLTSDDMMDVVTDTAPPDLPATVRRAT